MRGVSRVLVFFLGLGAAACMSWTPGWREAGFPLPGGDSPGLLAEAEALFAAADSRAALAAAIAKAEAAAAADPRNVEALSLAGEAWCLMGAAYCETRAEKRNAYLTAVRFCERAMGANPEFAVRVADGDTIDAAVATLGPREMAAMNFWATAVSYYFKECLSGLGHVVNFRWMKRERAVIERMSALDPEWGDGAVGFAWGIYYVALPESVGGDLERSRTILDGLVAARPDALLPRWGRGKYFHTRTRDKEACRRDLEWVVSQDPRRAPGKLAWNVYFHADASRLQERLDAMFAKRRPR